MKIGEIVRGWWGTFRAKQKFAVVDPDSGRERWHFFISPARIVVGALSLLLVLVVTVVLVIAYTPIMDSIPGYPGRNSRRVLMEGIMRLDSLEREMGHLTVYSRNIDLIMEGKTPVVRDVTRIGDSVQMQDKTLVGRVEADSLLRAQMEGGGEYSLAGSSAVVRGNSEAMVEMVPPVRGVVSGSFSPADGRFGVEIASAVDSPVAVARDGSVVFSVWSPEVGWSVGVQHADNLVSIYRRLSQVEKQVGVRVKAGEIIGVASPLEFELWYNGTAVDPANYVVF